MPTDMKVGKFVVRDFTGRRIGPPFSDPAVAMRLADENSPATMDREEREITRQKDLEWALALVGHMAKGPNDYVAADPHEWPLLLIDASVASEASGDVAAQDLLVEAISYLLDMPLGEGHGFTADQAQLWLRGERPRAASEEPAQPPYPADLLDDLARVISALLDESGDFPRDEVRHVAIAKLDAYSNEVGRENVPPAVEKTLGENVG